MITWAEKLAFVGMIWKFCPRERPYELNVRVRIPGGAGSYGGGDTLEEALKNAARGMSMDWDSVGKKITEAAWADIAHC